MGYVAFAIPNRESEPATVATFATDRGSEGAVSPANVPDPFPKSVAGVATVAGPIAKTGCLSAVWREGFSRLSRHVEPCPTFRRWPAVYDAAQRFLDEHADEAAALGWGTVELWGVHHRVGTIRCDCSGALMISGGVPVVSVASDRITYRNGLVFYRVRARTSPETVPAWEFGR